MNSLIRSISISLLLVFLNFNSIFAQIGPRDWTKTNSGQEMKKRYDNHQSFEISIASFKKAMKSQKQEIEIPNPNGKFETFIIEPSQIPAPEVAHLYTVQTFQGMKKGDPTVLMACDISDGGFHAAVYAGKETYVIQPVKSIAPEKVAVFFMNDEKEEGFKCMVDESITDVKEFKANRSVINNMKYIYRLAICASGEYSQEYGGLNPTNTSVLNSMASGVNLLSPMVLRDLGVEFTLVSNNDMVFLDPNTHPFNVTGGALLEATEAACDAAIGNGNYDIGHLVLHRGVGGLAQLGVVCNFFKGEGFSGTTRGFNRLWLSLVPHELGHQMGSRHNFSAFCSGGNLPNSSDGYRYEPGSGSSMMAYASACTGIDIYAFDKDFFFHYASIEQIQNYLQSTNCAITNGNGNPDNPVADAKANITIPAQTPFVLVGSATDGNDPQNSLSYGWQQYNGDGPVTSGPPDCNWDDDSPIFKYVPPTANNYRSFPDYGEVLDGNNNNVEWEKLSCGARTMQFGLLVRDNNNSFGRVDHDLMTVNVTNNGPFAVTAPNGGETINGTSTVTWSVNGTDANCPSVDILLSLDGGTTYTVVADATDNDGSQNIAFPNSSISARILVRCDVPGGYRAASTFYDTSNGNFTITGGAPSCNDGIQNQGETGVDCGGPCAPCQTCDLHTLTLVTDNFPQETSWEVRDPNNVIVAQGDSYTNPNTTEIETFCLPKGVCFDFVIIDSQGDGICCGFGNGSYTVTNQAGTTVATGGQFTNTETTQICVAGGATCNDGIQNQGETGVDCGGPCTPCQTCDMHTLTLVTDNFPDETSWEVRDPNNVIVAQGDNYTNQNTTEIETFCLPTGVCFDFVIFDSQGDGICCGFGNGSYTVTNQAGTTVATGGQFTNTETTQICVTGNNNCSNNLNFIGPVDNFNNTQILSTNENITASNTILAGANISYLCGTVNGKYVELKMNFTVQAGAEFLASPDGCQN